MYSCRNFRKFRPIPRTHKTVPVEKQSKVPALRPVFQNPTPRTVRGFSSAPPLNQCNFTKSRVMREAISGHSGENFHFSTILPPLRLLRLRTNLYITLYKKNYRCAVLLFTRETRRFAEIAGNACGVLIGGGAVALSGNCRKARRACNFVHKVFDLSDGSPRACGCTGIGTGFIPGLVPEPFSRTVVRSSVYATVPLRQLQILAGAVREIEMDLRIPLYLSDTSPLTFGGVSAAAGSLLLPRFIPI